MPTLKTHLTALQKSAAANPSLSVLKIPELSSNGELEGWKDISYSQLLQDVEKSANYWSRELLGKGLNAGSVIAMWLKGSAYLDILHIWGISRAGYIPQLISARLPSHAVVRELLTEAGAKGLIYEPALTPSVGDEIFVFPAIDLSELSVSQFLLPELRSPMSGEDVIVILHSSGSTSGRPKLVPGTARWLDRTIEKARHFTFRPPNTEGQEIITANGSVCHIAGMLTFITFVDRSGCMVLPTSIPYALYELRRMVKECKITILNMFSSFIVGTIREAHKDPELLAMLQSFDACTHGGLPLEEKEGAWAREQGVNLVDTFASTEVGCMMLGIGGREGQFLQVWPESKFELRPICVAQDADSNIADGAYNQKLVELVVPRHAPECPHHSLCDEKTGEFITGDIFLEVGPNRYLPKGRNDDWIKMEISLRCDTRSIENNAYETCGEDLMSSAVVVGSARPSPALLVEAKRSGSHGELPDEILRRIAPFHARRYTHERIVDSRLIIVVPNGALPRTPKNTIQRMIAEREFKNDLNRAYSEVYS